MKDLARYVALGALFLIPFLPLVVSNTMFFPFITGKNFWFRILVEVALGAWVILAILQPKYRPRFSWTLAAFGAFVAWMALANALGVNPGKAFWSNYERMDGWVTLVHAFLLSIVAGSLLAVEKVSRAWWLTFISVSAFVCLHGLLQLGGSAEIHQSSSRLDASFGNAAYLAAYLLFAIAVTVWQGLISRGGLRWTLLALAGLQAFILFMTATRGAIVALVAGAIFCGLVYALTSGGRARKIGLGISGLVLVLVGMFMLVRTSSFVQNDPTLSRLAAISFAELEIRSKIWGIALEGIQERPLLGWGQDGFNHVFTKHYHPGLYAQEPWFDRAHNLYLDWAIAGGIPALFLFLSLLGMSAYALMRYAKTPAERALLLSALAAYGVQGLVVFDNLFTYIPLAVILAHAHARSSRSIESLEKAPVPGEATGFIALTGVGAATIILIWLVNVPSMAAASDLIRAMQPQADPSRNIELFEKALAHDSLGRQEIREQAIQFYLGISGRQEMPQELKTPFAEFALGEIEKEIARQPQDARLRIQAATAYRVLGDYESALAQVEAALAVSPQKQSLHTERGIIYWQQGRYSDARDAFRTAYEFDSSFDELAAYLAAGEIISGNLKAGNDLLMTHFGTTTVDRPVLLLAHYERGDYVSVINIWKLRVTESGGGARERYGLASAYALAGRTEEARAEVRATMTAHPETAQQGAQLLMRLGGR